MRQMPFGERVLGAFLSNDGTFSISKTARVIGWTFTSMALLMVALGMAVGWWEWDRWQSAIITMSSIWVGGGLADNVGHRLSYKKEADRREDPSSRRREP